MNDANKARKLKLEEMKAGIKARLSRPSFVKELDNETKSKAEKTQGWILQEIKDDPGSFALLVFSSIFTAMLGLYLGLAPHLAPNPNDPQKMDIVFNSDFGHVATAIIYMCSFVMVTEVAVFYSRHKFHTREENNIHQLWSMWVAMIVGVLAVIVTGGAGGSVVASTVGFLDEFVQVPPSLQKYLVWIVPALFGLYFCLHSVYKLSSNKARSQRVAQMIKEDQELEHKIIMDALELEGEEEFLLEEVEAYRDLVKRGKGARRLAPGQVCQRS
jgi:hypothetical protein